MNDTARRALRGYGVGAGITVLAASAAMGPFFPWGLMVGTALALVIGVVVALPVCLLLARLGQLRPWWAALLGAVVLLLPLVMVNPGFQGVDYLGVDRSFVFVNIGTDGKVTPHWPGIGVAAFGALAGLAGWAAAFGFRLRPPAAPSENTGEA